jgi:uncharacterized protein (TIGR02265 family)
MNHEPTYSETAVEAMFVRGFGDRLSPAVRAQLKQAGLDLDRPLSAAYPQAVFDGALKLAVESVFPSLPASEAHFEAGKLYMQGFDHTLLGKAVVQMGKLIGPERTLGRMQRNQRTTSNFGSLALEKLAPTHFVIHSSVEPEFIAGLRSVPGYDVGSWVSGIYFGVLLLLEVRNPKVTHHVLNLAEQRIDYDLSWDA